MSWNIEECDFPYDGTLFLQLRFALQYAVLAPSSHNSQPWRFLIADREVQLVADRSRALPVLDPYDRELTISCGAALTNFCVALAHFGIGFEIDAFPPHADPDVIAVLRVDYDRPADAALARLFPALRQRATNRGRFEPAPVPKHVQEVLRAEASAEGVTLSPVRTDDQRKQVADLITLADQLQFADPRFRRELAAWIHSARANDGMPAYAFSVPKLMDFTSPVFSLVARTFDLGEGVAARDSALVEGSPLLLCFSTGMDNPAEWLFAGQALERVLLLAKLEGYDASYLNQPIEVPELRERLRQVLALDDTPQLLIRLGKGAAAPHTPRRPVDEVVS